MGYVAKVNGPTEKSDITQALKDDLFACLLLEPGIDPLDVPALAEELFQLAVTAGKRMRIAAEGGALAPGQVWTDGSTVVTLTRLCPEGHDLYNPLRPRWLGLCAWDPDKVEKWTAEEDLLDGTWTRTS